MTTLQIIFAGLGALSLAGALFYALRTAYLRGRAEVERERDAALAEAKARADGVRVHTRSTVVDKLRKSDF